MNCSLRSVVKVILDAVCVFCAAISALVLHYIDQPDLVRPEATVCGLMASAVTVLVLWMLSTYRSLWRYASIRDIYRVCLGILIGSAISCVISQSIGCNHFEAAVAVTEGALSVLLLGTVRVAVRIVISARRRLSSRSTSLRRVLILGAGDEGEAIARELLTSGSGRRPVGFIDDDPKKRRRMIHGIPVLGGVSEISRMAGKKRVDELIVTCGAFSPEMCGEVVSACADAGIRMRILPSVPDLLARKNVSQLSHEIDPQALLGRSVLPADEDSIRELIRGRTIIVTGAGGSIGSELCRQIARHSPHALYLLDQSENGIFDLEQELKEDAPFPVVPVVADVKDRNKLSSVFSSIRPSLVVHAAAHKHVPLMESYPEEAVKNNILGTLSVASVAAEYAVEKFVLISTDKAVRPSSVMGASKRVAEMIVQDIAGTSNTEFITVRFGNVLGSSGSVVPTMQRQILRGGPVTVTHPEMTRFFMTIPEAARLVLLAAHDAKSGDLMVLDMGRPVRILDLANLLIRLSGHTPDDDVEVRFVGTRPGEKLHEELLTQNESEKMRKIGSIMTSRTEAPVATMLHKAIAHLEALAAAGDRVGIRRELASLVPDYQPRLSENEVRTENDVRVMTQRNAPLIAEAA